MCFRYKVVGKFDQHHHGRIGGLLHWHASVWVALMIFTSLKTAFHHDGYIAGFSLSICNCYLTHFAGSSLSVTFASRLEASQPPERRAAPKHLSLLVYIFGHFLTPIRGMHISFLQSRPADNGFKTWAINPCVRVEGKMRKGRIKEAASHHKTGCEEWKGQCAHSVRLVTPMR
jgi:hypothetical protein